MGLHNQIICIAAAALLLTAGCAGGPGGASRDESPDATIASKFAELPLEDILAAGDQAMQQGDADRARFIYLQAISVEESAAVWFRLGQANARVKRQHEAWQAFASTLKLEPGHAGAHEELGLLYLSTRQRESARKSLLQAVSLDPTRWRSYNALGVLADSDGDYATAIGYYGLALEQRPESAMLLNNLGYSHYLAGQYRQAEQHLKMAVGIDGNYQMAIANLGLVYARTRAYEHAIRTLSQVMDEHEAYNDVGYVAFRNGDRDEALWLLTRATEISPTYYVTAYENLEQVRNETLPAMTSKPTEVTLNTHAPERVDRAPSEGAQHSGIRREYRQAEFGPLDVYAESNFESETVGQIQKGERVIQFFMTGGWSFIAFGDLASDEPSTGWIRTDYLAVDRFAQLD